MTAKQSYRAERLVPARATFIEVQLSFFEHPATSGRLQDISKNGLSMLVVDEDLSLAHDLPVTAVVAVSGDIRVELGAGVLRRVAREQQAELDLSLYVLGVAFQQAPPARLEDLRPYLAARPYVREELSEGWLADAKPGLSVEDHTLHDFHRLDSPDLFAKCAAFYHAIMDMQQKGIYQSVFRVTLLTGLDHRITVFNPKTRREEEMICFDSNSYLGLHNHPRVLEATRRALDAFGYGTASAQLLGGTSRHLRELEETLCNFHEREAALVFPSGYMANIGTLTALIRERDLVAADRFSHMSIHEGGRGSGTRYFRTYPHGDLDALASILDQAAADPGCLGKLIVTDGVFSMHGDLADLPRLHALARQYDAKLMVDDAHGTGILGQRGRGIEEHFGLAGAADILMGTFSKAPGTVGGYICGDRVLIDYLRFYARAAMFTAAPPAALCAGVSEAFRVMDSEPEHRERLWKNVNAFYERLHEIGLCVSPPESAIVTVFVGSNRLLWRLSQELFDRGIKCGNVDFPAVPRNETILRFSLNATHTPTDLDRAAEVLALLGRAHGILHRTQEEICEIGASL